MLSLYQPSLMGTAKLWYPDLRLGVTARLLRRLLLITCSAVMFSVAALRLASMVEAAQIIPVTPSVSSRTTTPAASIPSLPVTTQPAAPAIACIPFGTVPLPAPLSLTTPGLVQLVDPPQTYSINGSSSTEVASQLRHCAPTSSEGSFSGTTTYWLGTHYSYRVTDSGACHLTDISVGIHVSQVLPHRTESTDYTALDTKWNTYMRNLITHENGHTSIDITQAQLLLNELSALPDMPCETISATASNVTAARLSTLDATNDAYDASTNHGATQGAIWY